MTCRVRGECLEYALTTRELRGIWGGLTPRERVRLRADRRDNGRGPPPMISDAELVAVLTAADPDRPAAPQLQQRLGVSTPTAYKYLARAAQLGVVERRDRHLYPAREPRS